jgi:hypothetical protein
MALLSCQQLVEGGSRLSPVSDVEVGRKVKYKHELDSDGFQASVQRGLLDLGVVSELERLLLVNHRCNVNKKSIYRAQGEGLKKSQKKPRKKTYRNKAIETANPSSAVPRANTKPPIE